MPLSRTLAGSGTSVPQRSKTTAENLQFTPAFATRGGYAMLLRLDGDRPRHQAPS